MPAVATLLFARVGEAFQPRGHDAVGILWGSLLLLALRFCDVVQPSPPVYAPSIQMQHSRPRGLRVCSGSGLQATPRPGFAWSD